MPAMMLRLGKDQECYDFIKWWAVIDKDPQYDFRDLSLPYLDIKNADVFEPIDFCFGYKDVVQLVALILLKIKLLLDLTVLDGPASTVGAMVPQEILDQIQSLVPRSPIIAARQGSDNGESRKRQIQILKKHIDQLYLEINKVNKYILMAFRGPEHFVGKLPLEYAPGSMDEMRFTMQWSFCSWRETHGAFAFMKEKISIEDEYDDYISSMVN